MTIDHDVSLADYSTMHLGGKARHLSVVSNKEELVEAIEFANTNDLNILMIGGGSNIVWRDEGFDGLVIVNKLKQLNFSEDDESGCTVNIGAGEIWDEVVGRTVERSLSGIECLSLIPGSAGATPIQNIGAYGQEIASTLISLEAYDSQQRQFVTLSNEQCDFSYRDSRFKKERGRFLIASLKLRLNKGHIEPPFYASLAKYLADNSITDYSPASIRQAVIEIRQAKLPDPAVVHNCGSFFANPIVSEEKFKKIEGQNGSPIPHWPMSGGQIKIAAGWLIDKAGFKGYKDDETGMSTWPTQALVFVNDHASSTADLLQFKQHIVDTIESQFGIELIQEPELLP